MFCCCVEVISSSEFSMQADDWFKTETSLSTILSKQRSMTAWCLDGDFFVYVDVDKVRLQISQDHAYRLQVPGKKSKGFVFVELKWSELYKKSLPNKLHGRLMNSIKHFDRCLEWTLLTCDKNVIVELDAVAHASEFVTRSLNYVPIPSMNVTNEFELQEIYEWAGLVHLRADRLMDFDQVSPFISKFAPPMNSQRGQITVTRLKGWFTSETILRILSSKQSDWHITTTWGFALNLNPLILPNYITPRTLLYLPNDKQPIEIKCNE